MNNSKKINWRVYERGHLYPQNISAYLDLIRQSPAKNLYLANHFEVMTFYKDYFWWARAADFLKNDFMNWLDIWLKNKKVFERYCNHFEKSYGEAVKILPALKKNNLTAASNQQLFKDYEQAKNIFYRNILFSEYTVDQFDDFFGDILSEKILSLTKQKPVLSDLSQLNQPAYLSQNSEYRKELLKLSFSGNYLKSTLDRLAKTYGWVEMSWDGAHEKTASDIGNELANLKRISVTKRQLELEKNNSFVLNVKNERRILLKKYGLKPQDLKQYFELLDTFGKFHDWRKEIQMRSNQVILRTLKEMAFRFNLNYDDLLFYTGEDIKKLCFLKKKVVLAVIKKRKTGVTWVIKDGKVKEYLGRQAKKILDKLVLNQLKVKEINEVKGLSACMGKISGRVLIGRFARQANQQIKSGQILITSMTTIDYLPAMRKAAAIITDDGGITCHAAIVSRELKKPCIIGTKNATRVFKDGDLVEVDTKKGIVKKL